VNSGFKFARMAFQSKNDPLGNLQAGDFLLSDDQLKSLSSLISECVHFVSVLIRFLLMNVDLTLIHALKFSFILFVAAKLGNLFSCVSLLYIGFLLLFSIPKIRKDHREEINFFVSKLEEKFPKTCSVISRFMENLAPIFRSFSF